MDDLLRDPNFPHRPDHQDFWRMSNLILKMDGAAVEDPNFDIEALVNEHVDSGSLSYMALQRAMRAFGAETMADLLDNREVVMRGASLYTEAFLMGAQFAEAKQTN
jgi:hypothetical protein